MLNHDLEDILYTLCGTNVVQKRVECRENRDIKPLAKWLNKPFNQGVRSSNLRWVTRNKDRFRQRNLSLF